MQVTIQRKFPRPGLLIVVVLNSLCMAAAVSVTIVDRSPFIPSGFSPPQTREPARPSARPTQASEIEFRGIYEIAGEYRVLISEARSRNGRWLSVGSSHENIEVTDYDPSTETVSLLVGGEPREMQLVKTEANPDPQPVMNQVSRPVATTRPALASAGATRRATPTPVRRTIRPSVNRVTEAPASAAPQSSPAEAAGKDGSAPPPPAWLQELRERAAQRRAEAEAGSGK
jgi:hypothetical protein